VPARLVIVTDRRVARDLPAQLDAMLAALPAYGAIVQVREKDLGGAALYALTKEIVAVAKGRAQVVVNDRLDVALAAGADGVHLPEDGMPIADARALAGRDTFLVGCSRHSREGVLAAERDGAHYIVLGPIFATPSKAAYGAPLGPAALTGLEPRNALLYAIGGIETAEQAAACRAAGAVGVAAIRALWTAPAPGAVASALYLAAQGE
jgi:thiamine-phosphate pyrophosphorylase